MNKPYLCTINNSYIVFLQKADSRVSHKPARPYVAIAIKINGYNYAIPLTSKPYRPNGKSRNPRFTLEVPDSHGRPIAAMLFNNMIPVSSDNINKIDIKKEPKSFRSVDESRFINQNEEKINNKALVVYNLRKSQTDSFCNTFACDFSSLEKCCELFQRNHTQCNGSEKHKDSPQR